MIINAFENKTFPFHYEKQLFEDDYEDDDEDDDEDSLLDRLYNLINKKRRELNYYSIQRHFNSQDLETMLKDLNTSKNM